MTNIQFSNRETTLLNYGSKYNMGIPPKQCLMQIIQEMENAINQVHANQQEAIRYLATKHLRRIVSNYHLRSIDYKQDIHTAK
jgi:hypothetical protein